MNKRQKTGGRTKGTPNKATALNRDFIQNMINQQTEKLEHELTMLQGKDYINAVLQLLEFVVPKMQKQQVFMVNESHPMPRVPVITEHYDEETECSSFTVTYADQLSNSSKPHTTS